MSFRVYARSWEDNKFSEGEWNKRERGHTWRFAMRMAMRTEYCVSALVMGTFATAITALVLRRLSTTVAVIIGERLYCMLKQIFSSRIIYWNIHTHAAVLSSTPSPCILGFSAQRMEAMGDYNTWRRVDATRALLVRTIRRIHGRERCAMHTLATDDAHKLRLNIV